MIEHKCYCGHTTTCDCGMSAELIMIKKHSEEKTIELINELVRVKCIEYANWFEDNRRLLGLSDEKLYQYWLNSINK